MKTLLKYLALGVIGVVCLYISLIYTELIAEGKTLSYETFVPLHIGETFGFLVFGYFFSLIFFSPFLWITDKFFKNYPWRYSVGGIISGFVLGYSMANGNFHHRDLVLFTTLGLIGSVLLTLITWWIDRHISK